jgi:hypothetical protein
VLGGLFGSGPGVRTREGQGRGGGYLTVLAGEGDAVTKIPESRILGGGHGPTGCVGGGRGGCVAWVCGGEFVGQLGEGQQGWHVAVGQPGLYAAQGLQELAEGSTGQQSLHAFQI